MSVLQFYMLQELAKELNGAGFPNIQDVQHDKAESFSLPTAVYPSIRWGKRRPLKVGSFPLSPNS